MVSDALRSIERQSVTVATEVPLLHRSIDLVIRDGSVFVAIEFKVHDWKRAIQQASDHLVAADLVYVCLPSRKITARLLETAESNGLGVMSYDPHAPMTVVTHPPQLASPWPEAKVWLAEAFSFRVENMAELFL